SRAGRALIRAWLPARLGDARQLTQQGALPEADAAEGEAAHEGAGPPADEAAVVATDLELGRSLRLGDHRFLGHRVSPALTRRTACRGARAASSIPRRSWRSS